MKAASLVLFAAIFMLLNGTIYGHPHQKFSRQEPLELCRDPKLKGQIYQTLDQAKDVLKFLQIRVFGRHDVKIAYQPPSIRTICNKQFLRDVVAVLTQKYIELSQISKSIPPDDNLLVQTYSFLNNIGNTISRIDRGIDVLTLLPTQTSVQSLLADDSSMIMHYLRLAQSVESYLHVALCVLDN